ncbi:MAG: hypothetical protein AAGF30_13675, partial [Pseudomonadota bacterium]
MSTPLQPFAPTLVGTGWDDALSGTSKPDQILGLAGDDTVAGGGGADLILGDGLTGDLLTGPGDALTLDQYAEGGAWMLGKDADGHQEMSQTIETVAGARYELAFELAAVIAQGGAGTVEVLWNGASIGSARTDSGVFAESTMTLEGTGEPGDLTLRLIPDAPIYDTSGPVASY